MRVDQGIIVTDGEEVFFKARDVNELTLICDSDGNYPEGVVDKR